MKGSLHMFESVGKRGENMSEKRRNMLVLERKKVNFTKNRANGEEFFGSALEFLLWGKMSYGPKYKQQVNMLNPR